MGRQKIGASLSSQRLSDFAMGICANCEYVDKGVLAAAPDDDFELHIEGFSHDGCSEITGRFAIPAFARALSGGWIGVEAVD
jgi:hypothetical protein